MSGKRRLAARSAKELLEAAADQIIDSARLLARHPEEAHGELRKKLRHRLGLIGYWLDLRRQPSAQPKRAKEIRQAARQAQKSVRALQRDIARAERLTGDSLSQWLEPINEQTRQAGLPKYQAYRSLGFALPQFLAGLEALERQLSPPSPANGPSPRRARERGVDELICSLAELYEDISGKRPGTGSGNDVVPSGPFLRMIETVWAVVGWKATSAARRSRVRRALFRAAQGDNSASKGI